MDDSSRPLCEAGGGKEEKGNMEKKYSNEYVKYEFSESEKRDIATDMALKVSELSQAEDDKKAIMSELKSRIDTLAAQVNNSATKLNNGYEMRTVKCEIIPDWKNKVWQYWREDNGSLAFENKMSAKDLQMKITE